MQADFSPKPIHGRANLSLADNHFFTYDHAAGYQAMRDESPAMKPPTTHHHPSFASPDDLFAR